MIHASADVLSKNIGEGTNIWQFCVVLPSAIIGKNCNICSHCFIENDVKIGNNVTIKNGVQLWDGIEIEDNVFIGPNVTFTNDSFPRSKHYPRQFLKTVIKKGASIGANATILPGITIGENAMIAAGAIVNKDVAANTKLISKKVNIESHLKPINQQVSTNTISPHDTISHRQIRESHELWEDKTLQLCEIKKLQDSQAITESVDTYSLKINTESHRDFTNNTNDTTSHNPNTTGGGGKPSFSALYHILQRYISHNVASECPRYRYQGYSYHNNIYGIRQNKKSANENCFHDVYHSKTSFNRYCTTYKSDFYAKFSCSKVV